MRYQIIINYSGQNHEFFRNANSVHQVLLLGLRALEKRLGYRKWALSSHDSHLKYEIKESPYHRKEYRHGTGESEKTIITTQQKMDPIQTSLFPSVSDE